MANTIERGRITARVSSSIEETLKEAAELTGVLLNQFVVQASLEKAQKIIDRERFVKISCADAELILKTLNRAPQPNAALTDLFERHKELTKNGLFNGTARQRAQAT
ncbi:DUF1778 domain-containing protein [Rugamonas rubra]|uniref:type II toxin-antitoxin system TacA family antitoxin n=1 Tax=Rugamonas rubra TaxID=758825 RepID=UPI000B809B42|nr:DUF1778 domain-containing protein [Rugamonas rubra]